MNEIITHEITVNNWTLTKREDIEQPLIQDLLLAEKLGFKNPRQIRELIKRMIVKGSLQDVCRTVRQYKGRPAEEFLLSEVQALKVIAKSETEKADLILSEVIEVYVAYKRGQLTPPQETMIPISQVKEIVKEALIGFMPTFRELMQASQPAPQLQNRPTLQPSQSQPLQPELFRPAREMRWYAVFDICRDLQIDVSRFWALWQAARCNRYQRKQSRSGAWLIREDAYRSIEVQNDYR